MNLLTKHLDTWTTAPNGIKKLRELILELAVRGLLVPQNPDDEPASVLLEKIKKTNLSPKITEDSKFFILPKNWAWFRVGDYLTFEYGKSMPAKERDESGEIDVYGSNGIVGKHTETLVSEPCIVVGRKGSAGALNKALNPCWVTDVAYSVLPPSGFNFEYTFLILKSLKLDELGKGIKPGVNRNEAYALVSALPPLAEQHHIVAKVDELMQLCDQLEQKQISNQEIHAQLVSTLLTTLTQTTDPQAFQAAWTRIATSFDSLFTTESSIEQLKQTILQLAVMGKLVEQEAGDEPASVLLEKIAQEKARLISEGKIKKSAPLPKIADDEKPFELPNGWEWVRLEDVAESSLGKMLDKAKNKGEYQKYLRNLNVRWFCFNLTDLLEMRFKESEEAQYTAIKNDVLICEGGYPGRAAIWEDDEPIYFQKAIHRVRFYISSMNKWFLYFLFLSDLTRDIEKYFTGMGIQHFTGKELKRFVIPLPPLAEQHRIVAKVDELMALCDQLKTKLNTAQTLQTQLAEALVQQVA